MARPEAIRIVRLANQQSGPGVLLKSLVEFSGQIISRRLGIILQDQFSPG